MTSEQTLYNSLASLVIHSKQIQITLEELNFAIQKSEKILICHISNTSNENRNKTKSGPRRAIARPRGGNP